MAFTALRTKRNARWSQKLSDIFQVSITNDIIEVQCEYSLMTRVGTKTILGQSVLDR